MGRRRRGHRRALLGRLEQKCPAIAALRPYRPTLFGAVLVRSSGATSVALRGYYGSASLALEGANAVVAVKDALTLYGVAIEASHQLASLGPAASLMVGTGSMIEKWDLSGTGSHIRAGAGVSLSLRVPLGGWWETVVRGGAAVSGSPFTDADLDPDFMPRALWRRDFSARVLFRL